MRTDVKLNDNYYKLMRLPTQTLANQMASKVGQGTSMYGDLTTWSAWIQDDWQEGVGNLRPGVNGGFLYGEVESRVPSQLILPQKLFPTDTLAQPGYNRQHYIDTYTTYKELAYNDTVAIPFTPASIPGSSTRFYVLASVDNYIGGTIGFKLFSTTAGGTVEGAQISSGIVAISSVTPGYYWYGCSLNTAILSAGNIYWLEFSNATAFGGKVSIAGGDSNSVYPTVSYFRPAGGAWSSLGTTIKPYFMTGLENIAVTTAQSGNGLFRFNGNLYAHADKKLFKWSTDKWVSVAAITGINAVTEAVVFADKVYFGNEGGDLDYTTMTTAEVFADTGQDGKLFLNYNGFLYRARVNTVEYSSDGAVWEPTLTFGKPITVSDTSDPITGMCGMGENIYVSTTKGLVCIYPGGIARTVVPWGSTHTQNGVRMKNFQGALYIVVNGRVIRFTEDGSHQDVWMTRDDDLLTNRIGRVITLEVMNNWLLALVVSGELGENGNPTIWAYQNSKWHHISTLPTSTTLVTGLSLDFDLYYDRALGRLWCITVDSMIYWWHISDYSLNPYNDPHPDNKYATTAWVEWDWFSGQILEAQKDFESISIMGENLDFRNYVKAYWKDDDSTQWELLGTFDSNIKEIRWTLSSGTRPNSKRIKLGLLLVSEDFYRTPRIRAVRVKYHLMVRDWFRWNLVIDVAGRTGAFQMTQDGKRNNLTALQIKDALSDLCLRVPPFVYQDVDGKQYEVKVIDGNFQYVKNEYNELTGVSWLEGHYSLVVEQVTQGVAA